MSAAWTTIIVIIAVIAIALFGAGLYFYQVGIRRSKKEFLDQDPNLIKVEHPWESEPDWLAAQQAEELSITSSDGLKLSAIFLPASAPAGKTAILAHGYSGQGREMASFARWYQEHGYHVLMPDTRGHGQSEGDYIGFGWHDRLDYKVWIEEMLRRQGSEEQLVLHGVSMGAATVLMLSGEELPEQVKCIVSDCAYTSAEDILSYQLKQMYKLPAFPLIPVTSLICKWKAGYYFGEASALNQVRKTKLPVLFIHGEEDAFVPFPMVHQLFEAAGGEKELLTVPHAQHGNAYFTDKQTVGRTLDSFLKRYVTG